MSAGELREYVRIILSEDSETFVAAAREKSAAGFKPSLPRDIKKLWNAEADHSFFAGLTKVHWARAVENLKFFVDPSNRRNEVSVMLYRKGDRLDSSWGRYGVVLEGRVTLAANDMNALYSGSAPTLLSRPLERLPADPERRLRTAARAGELRQQTASSGLSRRPEAVFGAAPGKDAYESFILDERSFDPGGVGKNEGILDNWRPTALVIAATDSDTVDAALDKISHDPRLRGLPVVGSSRRPMRSASSENRNA